MTLLKGFFTPNCCRVQNYNIPMQKYYFLGGGIKNCANCLMACYIIWQFYQGVQPCYKSQKFVFIFLNIYSRNSSSIQKFLQNFLLSCRAKFPAPLLLNPTKLFRETGIPKALYHNRKELNHAARYNRFCGIVPTL